MSVVTIHGGLDPGDLDALSPPPYFLTLKHVGAHGSFMASGIITSDLVYR